ncbi:probable WRKY transcription factor 70 [Lolium rigidum]|uniref:probable WRKY transcription factor 70 n=1 Tax=Lolium rigidum TaxID=89674 RepID=UPI001F5C9C98|nr:probable WRKY transcription factor 70 [Lolium rigidum]
MEHSKISSSSSNDDRLGAALTEMAREQSLVALLRAVVLPALQLAGVDSAEVVPDMFESILDCSTKAIAELKLIRLDRSSAKATAELELVRLDRSPGQDAVDHKRIVRKILSGDANNAKQRKRRRRLADDSVKLETPVPDYDGHQWRKYGQKPINNAMYPRNYYQCTYMKENGCKATKTVQQQEEGAADDGPAMYAVVYYGQHTCKPCAAVVGAGSGADELARSDSQCSNISVTCTSAVVDHHHNRTASVESNCNLLDMAGDLAADAELNAYGQLLDVAGFSPFDLETPGWAIDSQAHGLLKYGDW